MSVDRAVVAAARHAGLPAALRAAALHRIAHELSGQREPIIACASAETALTQVELGPEFERMTGTLRMFAELLRDNAWARLSIDRPAAPGSAIGPNHDIRSMLVPLGDVVAVFGASNFPLAYGVCGGDTASALAAGCAVVVKEHPAHPKTGRLIASIARAAVDSAGGPADLLGYVINEDSADVSVATELVQHPRVGAVGFTGSTSAGMAIEKLARERVELGLAPIPVFAEMGSSNIVVITRGAWAERGEKIVDELAAALVARAGQQCTNVGVVVIDKPGASRVSRTDDGLVDYFVAIVNAAAPRRMLSPRIRDEYADRLDDIAAGEPHECSVTRGRLSPEQQAAGFVAPAVVRTDLAEMCEPRYCYEIFGPACVVVHADLDDPRSLEELFTGLNGDRLWGALVASIYLGREVNPAERNAVQWLARIAGRVVFNGVPTGVRVCEAMVHAGPYPATNQPHTTAVGPRAIERWCRPVCFQNAPRELLPEALRDR